MRRSAASLALSVLVVAACATTPTQSGGSPKTPTAIAPAPSGTPRPTSVTPTPSPSPAPTSATLRGAGGWPRTADGMSPPRFGPDGTAYLLFGGRDTQDKYQQSLVALDAAGQMKPGWPIEEPLGSDFASLAVGPDGSVYFGECGSPQVGCVLHRLGTDGRELPGWPSRLPPDITCDADGYCFNRVQFGPDGTVYVSLFRQVGALRIFSIDGSGRIVPGWPVVADAKGVSWSDAQVGSDGTLFILGEPEGSDSPASLAAFGRDGNSRPGWPVSVPDRGGFLLGPQGTVVLWSWIDNVGELCPDYRRTVFAVLGPDGRTLPGWPRGSKGFASIPVVDADGTVYYVSALGNVYAHDRAGEIKTGWPVAMPGAINECGPASPYLARDKTIYVLADDDALGSEVTARSPDGRPRPGWPYRPTGRLSLPCLDIDCPGYHVAPAFGPDSTVYLVVYRLDPTSRWLEVIAVDRQGQLKPGWPYRLPIDPTAGMVESLTVSPDGRLFVQGGYDGSDSSFLLALDPDGRVSD